MKLVFVHPCACAYARVRACVRACVRVRVRAQPKNFDQKNFFLTKKFISPKKKQKCF